MGTKRPHKIKLSSLGCLLILFTQKQEFYILGIDKTRKIFKTYSKNELITATKLSGLTTVLPLGKIRF